MRKKKVLQSLIILLVLALTFSFLFSACTPKQNETNDEAQEQEGFRYQHDPRDNPSAIADIEEDETAIYGFRPSKTGSLVVYADADWSDAEVVAKGRQDRIEYHTFFRILVRDA